MLDITKFHSEWSMCILIISSALQPVQVCQFQESTEVWKSASINTEN